MQQWRSPSKLDVNDRCCSQSPNCFSAERTNYRGNSSHLDLYVINDTLNIIFPTITPTTLSILDYPLDHRAVELTIDLQSSPIKSQPTGIPNFNQTDWKLFNQTIDAGISQISLSNNCNMTTDQIDTPVGDITSLINDSRFQGHSPKSNAFFHPQRSSAYYQRKESTAPNLVKASLRL